MYRWKIFLVDLDPTIGSEQGNKETSFSNKQ